MLKNNLIKSSYLNRALDIIINGLCFVLSQLIIHSFFPSYSQYFPSTAPYEYVELFLLFAFFMVYIGRKNKVYSYDRYYDLSEVTKNLLYTQLAAMSYALVVYFLFRRDFPMRFFIVLYFVMFSVFSVAFHFFFRKAVHYFSSKSEKRHKVFIFGNTYEAEAVIDEISQNRYWGFNVIGVKKTKDNPMFKYNELLMDDPLDFDALLKKHALDLVIFPEVGDALGKHREYLDVFERAGVMTMISLKGLKMNFMKTEIEYIGLYPMIFYSSTSDKHKVILLKFLFDKICSFIALLVLLPLVFVPVAIAVKLTSKGSVFFVQERVGLGGRKFRMYKFRTMVKDAEQIKQSLMSKNEMDGPVFKIKKDPRLTPIGGFLRRYSIDELPQLFNILKGEMSIVGPRPPLPEEVWVYKDEFRRRLSIKPGLTCLWQISGRSEIDFNTWMQLDMKYIDNWSFIYDIIIIFKTIISVFERKGAY